MNKKNNIKIFLLIFFALGLIVAPIMLYNETKDTGVFNFYIIPILIISYLFNFFKSYYIYKRYITFLSKKDFISADNFLSKYSYNGYKITRLNLLLISGRDKEYELNYIFYHNIRVNKYFKISLYSYKIYYDFLNNNVINISDFNEQSKKIRGKNKTFINLILPECIKLILNKEYKEALNLLDTHYLSFSVKNDFIKYLMVYIMYQCSIKIGLDIKLLSENLKTLAYNDYLKGINNNLGIT